MMKVYSSKHSLTESAKDAKQFNGSLNRTTSSQNNPFGDNYSESGRSARSGNPFSDDGNPFSDTEAGNPFSGKSFFFVNRDFRDFPAIPIIPNFPTFPDF